MLLASLAIIKTRLSLPGSTSGGPALPRAPVSLDGAAIKGQRSARVGILQFSDFHCSFCARFAREVLPAIEEAYIKKGAALIAFRHLPLVRIHPQAMRAAESAECARRQGAFWEAHDRLFDDTSHFDGSLMFQRFEGLRIDRVQFEACMSGQATAAIKTDIAEAGRVGIRITPTFLLGTIEENGRLRVERVITGARQFNEFQAAIDGIIARQRH
jgi:protein-disulfide isomerase